MKNLCLFLFLPAFTLCFYGQVYKPIAFPEKVEARYIMNPLKEQEKYQKKLAKSLPKKVALDYSVAQTFGKANMFTNGEIYLSWPAMEMYVNQVLDSIMPANLTSKKIRAFIGRNSDINAYCLYDGTMIVNVGLLAEVKNEAALAAVMGHELGHYIKNHIVSRIKNQQKKTKKKTDLEKALNAQGFSQDNELEADIQGFSIAKSANYDLEDAYSNFEMFIREEEYYAKRNKSTLANTDSVTINTKAGKFSANTLEKLLSSHPDMKLRKEKLAAYIKSNPQIKKIKFKIDEDYFDALQAQARLECVGLLYDFNNYQECLERSFIYYLFNPGELSFSYYIAESVRRLCLLDYRLRKQGFLTEKLVNDGFKEGEGILHDLKFLIPDPLRYKALKASELLKTGPFETYRDAFAYFTKKLLDKNYNEVYLMRALFENNKVKIKDNVTKYLSSPNIKHKEYAINYRDSTLTKAIAGNNGEMVLIPKVNFYRNSVYNYKYVYGNVDYYFKKSEILGKEMSYEFASTFNAEMSDVKTISLPQAATQNFNMKYRDETVLNRTLLARRDENEGYKVVHYYKELEDEDYISTVDIFRLDPETWEFFKSNEINALTYAYYTRHTNLGARKMRNLMLILGIPTGGLTWLFAPFNTVQYKELDIYSYDARLGRLYVDSDVRKRRLNATKALRMFKKMKKDKIEFINDYNSKY
jgi:Zn-dependent protease with chaperone function